MNMDKATAGTIRTPDNETRYDTLKAKVVSFIHAYRDTQGKDIQEELKALEEEVTQTREEWEAEVEERAERFFETYQLKEK